GARSVASRGDRRERAAMRARAGRSRRRPRRGRRAPVGRPAGQTPGGVAQGADAIQQRRMISRFLTADHERLEALLRRALAVPGTIDREAYDAFRKGPLRHIGMEEKILFPAAQRARGGEPLPCAARLRLDHGALAALLVPSPTATIGDAIRTILERHNTIEEGPQGVYAACERFAGPESEALLAALEAAPEAPVAPHLDVPLVVEAMRRALVRAGWEPAVLGLCADGLAPPGGRS